MSKIEMKQVTFGFDQQNNLLFDNINLIIDSSWKLGLIGRNGRGKTTLLRLLQGQYDYSGKIVANITISYFPQPVKDKHQLTCEVLQEVAVDVEPWKIEREFRLLGLETDMLWRPFSSLSGGEQTKVLLSALFADESDFPLIDEPTNHLDSASRKQVASYLKNKKNGFIVVSHDRLFIDNVVDHILAIDKAKLSLYQGNYSTYSEQKQLNDQHELDKDRDIRREMSRLKQTAREKAEWATNKEKDKYGNPNKKGSGAVMDTGFIGAKSAKLMKRSKSLVKRLEKEITEKEKLLKNIEHINPLKIEYVPTHHKRVMSAKEVQLGYDKPLFQPVTFELNQGECLFIKGDNGSGKSSFIKYLLGEFSGDESGLLEMPKDLEISYVRQDYEDNRGHLADFAKEHKLLYEDFLNNLFKLGVERDVFHQKIEDMSMGQKKRVELAKSLSKRAELFIWDEPLNYLDIFNKEQIEAVIQQVKPTMIIVEHDESFSKKLKTKVLDLSK